MEAVCSSETLAYTYKSTRLYNPDGQHLHLNANLHILRESAEAFKQQRRSALQQQQQVRQVKVSV
jgi:hypothetical protein